MKFTRLLVSTCAAAVVAGVATPALAGDVAGFVYDATDTIALQSAQVRVVELNRVATTERDGSYLIANLPEGTYTLEVRYVGAETVTQTIDVPATGMVQSDIAMGGSSAEILVLGQAANQASALSRKRESDTVSDVITRDAIGQFPDQNVAESLRRLPGVNVLNDQGEGRFVSVRGLDPELNSTSLNGVRLPAPESDVRSVALDVISSDIIESIEVKKSLTPDMDADTIGASIEIETTSAFDRKKDLLTAKVEGSYNDYADFVSPKGSFDFATRITDNFGVSGGASYYKRKFETDNIEADDWKETDDGDVYAEEVQYRDYDVERKRFSATLGFDLRVDDNTELYLKGIYSQFDDQEYRRRTTFKFDEEPSSFSGRVATYDDADGEIEVERDIKDRFESQKIRSIVFGGETDTGEWKAKYSASWAKSSELEKGSIDPTKFDNKWEEDGLQVLMDYSDYRMPIFSIAGDDAASFYDAGSYELDDIEYVTLSDSQDEEFALKFDLGREFLMDGGTFTVQAGAKARWREKSYNMEVSFWETADGVDYYLSDVLGEQTYRITDLGPVASYEGPSNRFLNNPGDFEENVIDGQFDSSAEDYSITEDVMAGYLLGRWDSSTLRVIGGVRYEHTSNDITGNTVTYYEDGATLPDNSEAAEEMVLVTENFVEKDYEHWLPSLNIRWEAQNNLVMRLAGYKSLVRPKLSKLAPRFIIEQNDDNEREGEFGNPDLKPYEAWNFDASVEYYLSGNGAVTAAAFYKDVKNFIYDYNIEWDDESGDPLPTWLGYEFNEATVPFNGNSGEIFGVEIGYSQAFTMLPEPFDGLLLQANYTYTDAKGTVPIGGFSTPAEAASADTREIQLPATSQNTFNLVLGYDKGPIDLRLSGTYRDKYLDELGDEAAEDRWVDNHFQLDLTAKYKLTDNIKIYYEWVNINNAKYTAYNNVGGQRNLYQYEEYNWTMKAGVRVNF